MGAQSWRSALLVTLIWCCCTVSSEPITAASAAAGCGHQPAALSGDVLVLSVGSMRPAFGAAQPEGADPASCCKACQETDGCAAWSLCTKADGGCGKAGECDAYVAAQRARGRGANSGSTPDAGGGGGEGGGEGEEGGQQQQQDEPQARSVYPVTRFGSFNEKLNTCTFYGRWPEHTCTLYSSAKAGAKRAAADGWVSGFSPKAPVPGCPAGLTKATCAACLAAKSPPDCFACLRRPRAYGARSGAVEACAACAGLAEPRLRAACAACVGDFGPGLGCAMCLLPAGTSSSGGGGGESGGGGGGSGGGRSYDFEASGKCFQCVLDGGEPARASTGCSECFVSRTGAPVDTAGCLACARDAKLPAAARAGCGACHDTSVQDRSGCLGCLASKGVASSPAKAPACGGCGRAGMGPVAARCYGCVRAVDAVAADSCSRLGQAPGRALSPDAIALAPKYYSCLAAAGNATSGPSDCGACLAIPRYAFADRCLACRASLARPSASWCSHCWAPSRAPERAQACERCLAKSTYENAFADCVFGGGPGE